MKNHLNIRSLDYVSVLRYMFIFGIFVLINNLETDVYPYSTAVLIAATYTGGSLIVIPLLFLSSFLVCGAFGLLAEAAISAGYCIIVRIVYARYGAKRNLGFVALCCLSLIGFLLIGDTEKFLEYDKRVLVSAITMGLAFFFAVADKAVSEKGLKYKLSYEECVAIFAVAIAVGIGACNYISPYVWKGIIVFAILLSCYLMRFGIGSVIAAVLGISLAVYYHDINQVAICLCLGLSSDLSMRFSRYIAVFSLPATDFFIYAMFNVYQGYTAEFYLPVIIGALIFAVIPTKPLKELKEKLYAFREKQLIRQTINRNRLMLSNRLYELSGVFTEMASAFNSFKENTNNEIKTKSAMEREILSSVCKNCKFYDRCKDKISDIKSGLDTMIDIGFAKGKLSLIDLPKELSETCIHPNDMLFGLNKMLAEYRAYAVSAKNLANGRELLADEIAGVSEILKGLALDSGALLKYQSRLERALSDNLFKRGFFASEILIYGENERITVSMIIAMKEFSLPALMSVINKTFGINMTLTEKSNITEEKIYLVFKRAADFDAVFGIANAVKNGSDKSGDTHSVVRISDEKFLVALSDGMGSGKEAENVSSVALSLIESFYKAGMKSDLILSTVNKLLSVNTEDNFTALDIAVIDLKNRCSDFIKYGSPYGFILSDGRVRIVEANSLPLGILTDLKPSVCQAEINDGDMLVFMTDGVADAFGSSGDIIDYIRLAPAFNPQSLADEILNKAIELSKGEKKDDMTVLCVRIFKKTKKATTVA